MSKQPMCKIILSSRALLKRLNRVPLFEDEELVTVKKGESGGVELRFCNQSMDVESNGVELNHKFDGGVLRRLLNVVQSISDQPITLRFDTWDNWIEIHVVI